MKANKIIKSYKGFDKDLKCRGFQYELGKDYELKGYIYVCQRGFHACENPIDVLRYYPPTNENGDLNRYCEVEQSGNTSNSNEDTKIASSKLHIGVEIGLNGLIEAGVKFALDKADWKSPKNDYSGDCSATAKNGYRSAATNTGYGSAATNTGEHSTATNIGVYSTATNTGDCSAATNTGDYSTATNTGGYSTATNTGYHSTAINTGKNSAATNTGDYSTATNTGYRSAATNTGYRSAATNTGDYSAATNTGYHSTATNTGNCSTAINTGDCSAVSVYGKESVAIITGKDGKAKGALGCWLVLTERGDWDGKTYPIKEVKAVKVDGEVIKADVWYRLIDGNIIEAD